jgi:hypothetical protein
MTPRACFTLLALASSLVAPRIASASPNFPAEVQKEWALPTVPDCIVCHQNDLGGVGTATKPFARSLEREGLVEEDIGSLDMALAALKAQNTDSDGDGIPDIDELQMGTDPNDGPGAFDQYPIPMTGCAVGLPKRTRPLPAALFALTGLLLALRRQRAAARLRKRRFATR